MKKRLLLITFFLVQISVAYCQTWAPAGATWTYLVGHAGDAGQECRTWTYDGDTIINGQSCKVINRHGPWVVGDFLTKLISYEDSNRIYFYDSIAHRFSVLYDFNKNVGETWTINLDTSATLIRVDTVSFDTINGVVTKVMSVRSPGYPERLGLDGKINQYLGSENAMTPTYNDPNIIYDIDLYLGLIQYEDSIFGTYRSSIQSPCIPLGIATGIEHSLKVYPNPTSNLITISIDNPSTIINITILDLAGKALIENGNNTTVNLGKLSSGTYILQVRTKDGVATKLLNKL